MLLTAAGSQLSASWHETPVHHVLCADHGELTHVTVASQPVVSDQIDGSPLSAANSQEADTADAHERLPGPGWYRSAAAASSNALHTARKGDASNAHHCALPRAYGRCGQRAQDLAAQRLAPSGRPRCRQRAVFLAMFCLAAG